jgi:hypothetical protein
MKQSFSGMGRWSRLTDQAQTFKKVDLANEDHCGTCSKPRTQRIFMTDDEIMQSVFCFTEIPTSPTIKNK